VKAYTKKNLPLDKIRRFLEPGPVVMVSSAHRGERDIMTMGWHMVLGFEPSLIGCFIWDENHSFSLIRRSKQCVVNLPTFDIVNTVIAVGNTHAGKIDKFERFGLTPVEASKVAAPMIAECYANFECQLVDGSMINKYSLFIFEVVKAHVATAPRYPKTVHYRGDGVFMVSGKNLSYRRRFKRVNL
jgi:flavin reductase (DIM6/NTAB) family NADH-FMN oxidoreductase RutF